MDMGTRKTFDQTKLSQPVLFQIIQLCALVFPLVQMLNGLVQRVLLHRWSEGGQAERQVRLKHRWFLLC